MANIVVLNIGGSILSPSEDNIFSFDAANRIRNFITGLPNYKFIVCVGGGFIARKYQKLLADHSFSKNYEHEVGVASINVNAVMLQAVLGEISEHEIIKYDDFDLESPIKFSKQVLISAAGAPGHSSDWNTVKLAIRAGVKKVFSLSNIEGVYNKDPKKFADAVMLPKLNWQEYLNLIGNPTEHLPGAKYPVDPLASRLGMENKIEFYVLSGDNLENLTSAIKSEDFLGSVIS
ncbi:MAG: hypothetical protein ACMG57_03545 [Candidatus Dojkabacteria bacterium]